MKIVIKGGVKEIAALVLALQEQQEVIKPPDNERERMIKALENRLSELKSLSSYKPSEIL